jgi:hypothetical protein
MSERKGLWSARARPGQDDATLLAVEHLHALRQLADRELRERVHATPDGHFLRERARSSSERRRYEFPTRWYRRMLMYGIRP